MDEPRPDDPTDAQPRRPEPGSDVSGYGGSGDGAVEKLALQVGTRVLALRVGQSLVLGRHESCDVRINHGGVSPRHALLRVEAGRVLLDDLDSEAGTHVAGQRVQQFDLRLGDIAVLGHIPVQVVAEHRVTGTGITQTSITKTSVTETRVAEMAGHPQETRDRPENVAVETRHRSLRNLPIRMSDEATFRDLMVEELRRTPWFTLSAVIHAAMLLLLYILLQPTPPGELRSVQIGTGGDNGNLPQEAFASADEPVDLEQPEINSELEEELEEDDREAFEVTQDLAEFRWPVAGGLRDDEMFLSKISAQSKPGDDILESAGSGIGTGAFKETVSTVRETGLEIVFVFDSTGSMGSVLDSTKARIGRMLEVLQALVPDARVGIVTFRDHGQDEDYLTRSIPLGQDFYRAINFMQVISARGGGTRPEAVREGLKEAFDQRWTRGARRVVVLIGDAPPHSNSMNTISKEARAFARQGSSFLHGIVTRPNGNRRLPTDTLSSFEKIAVAGKGQCLPFEDGETLLLQVLSLAFGEEYRRNLEEVYRIVDSRNSQISIVARGMIQNANPSQLRRNLARKPIPDEIVREMIRRPNEDLARQLIEILSRPRFSEPGRHAAAYALQHMLELRSPPLDPEEGGRLAPAAARQLAALVDRRF